MASQSANLDTETLWGGKESPFQTSYGKLMMWFFLVSDALTFSGLLVAYGFTRHDTLEAWPIGEETFNSLPG
jgi:cytochrome c oxidase subunit 3